MPFLWTFHLVTLNENKKIYVCNIKKPLSFFNRLTTLYATTLPIDTDITSFKYRVCGNGGASLVIFPISKIRNATEQVVTSKHLQKKIN